MTREFSVLSVDDSAAMLSIISVYLRGSEFNVVATAQDGARAIELVQDLKPQLILLDLVMPGLSGHETLQHILDVRPDSVVAIVSSLGFDDGVQECLAAGAKDYLQKPFSKEDLLQFLRNLVAKP